MIDCSARNRLPRGVPAAGQGILDCTLAYSRLRGLDAR
jgi:hypothetical protein